MLEVCFKYASSWHQLGYKTASSWLQARLAVTAAQEMHLTLGMFKRVQVLLSRRLVMLWMGEVGRGLVVFGDVW